MCGRLTAIGFLSCAWCLNRHARAIGYKDWPTVLLANRDPSEAPRIARTWDLSVGRAMF